MVQWHTHRALAQCSPAEGVVSPVHGGTDIDSVMRTYRYRLYPTRVQRESLDEQRAFACQLYNAALEQRRDARRRRSKRLTLADQQRDLTELRAAGMTPVNMNCWTQQHVLRRLDLAFAAFFRRCKAGAKEPGFPRFRSNHRYDSLTWSFAGHAAGCAIRDGRLRLQGIGAVKVKWHRTIPEDTILRTVTAVRSGERWYACFSLTVPQPAGESCALPAIGIDVGITTFAALSNGEMITGPRAGRVAQRKLRVAQRRLSRRKRGSHRRVKARRQVARAHERIANVRHDHAHKTARDLVSRFGLIAAEDLNVQGLASGMLARDVNDQGWGRFLTILESKAAEAGSLAVKVNARGTSQNCSACDGHVPKALSVRWHSCACGYAADRDVNAARNILNRGLGLSPQAPTWGPVPSVA
jgi:putative transposase